MKELYDKGMYFVGCGISGGAAGALHGASLMPGGAQKAWPVIQPMLKSIAAKAEDGTPCCEWVGPGGAGHYVKMVHLSLIHIYSEDYHSCYINRCAGWCFPFKKGRQGVVGRS